MRDDIKSTLEDRVSRLEKLLSNKRLNEESNKKLGYKAMLAVEAISKATDLISQIAISLEYDDNKDSDKWRSLESEANNLLLGINKLGFKL